MDIKRNLLILALAVVSYLMLLAWNGDYKTPVQSSAAASLEQPQTQTAPVTAAGATAAEDVPQIQGQAAPLATTTAPAASLITVTTPMQIVTIYCQHKPPALSDKYRQP